MSSQKQEFKQTGSGASRASLRAVFAVVAMASVSAVHAAGAGMTVTKDPVTGELRTPTAEEFSTLQKQQAKDRAVKSKVNAKAAPVASKAADAVDTERRADNGAIGQHVGEEFMSFSVATRKADGTTSIDCVTGADAANKLVKAPRKSTGKINKTDKEHGHAH